MQLIEVLRRLHDLGYVHGDIKPDNILLETPETSPEDLKQVYLIDYGKASKYWDTENNKHRPNFRVAFNNCEWFASKWRFLGHTYSRRDDIISLLYSLMYIRT
jgi:serine/threonine protein kinase